MAGKGSDIKAGGAFVELFVKDEKLAKGLESAKGKLLAFGKATAAIGGIFSAIGSGILLPMLEALRGFAETGDALSKMAARTGVAATELQKLDYIAKQSGTNLEDVEKALKHFEKTGHSPQQFNQMLESLAKIDSASLRARRAIELFGKNGTMMLPMIETLHKLGGEFDGLTLNAEQLKSADELSTSFTRLRYAIKVAMDQIAAAVAPVVTVVIELFSTAWKVVAGLARDFPILTRVMAVAGVACLALGAAFLATATAGAALAGVIAIIDVLLTPIGLITAAVVALIAYWAALTAVLAGATIWFVTCTKTGKALLDGVLRPLYAVLNHFKGLGDVFKTTFGSLGEALKTGNVKAAWEVMCLGMAAAFNSFSATVLRDIQKIILGFAALARATGQWILLPALQAGASAVGVHAKSLEDQAAKKQQELEAKAKSLERKDKEPGEEGYGRGERSSVAIGTSARAAIMSRQVMGAGRDPKDQALPLLQGIQQSCAASAAFLKDMKSKMPKGVFGP